MVRSTIERTFQIRQLSSHRHVGLYYVQKRKGTNGFRLPSSERIGSAPATACAGPDFSNGGFGWWPNERRLTPPGHIFRRRQHYRRAIRAEITGPDNQRKLARRLTARSQWRLKAAPNRSAPIVADPEYHRLKKLSRRTAIDEVLHPRRRRSNSSSCSPVS